MFWTEPRKRKVLATIDGLMTLVFISNAFLLVYGFSNWVHSSRSHGQWPMLGDEPLRLPWMHQVLLALKPEEAGCLIPFVLVPLSMGLISFAIAEPLTGKVFRWLFILGGHAITAAVMPLIEVHNCLCGEPNKDMWDEFIVPGASVALFIYAVSLAKSASQISPGSPLS